jgi:hypothetical protein
MKTFTQVDVGDTSTLIWVEGDPAAATGGMGPQRGTSPSTAYTPGEISYLDDLVIGFLNIS